MPKNICACFFALSLAAAHAQSPAGQPPEDRLYGIHEPGVVRMDRIRQAAPSYPEIARKLRAGPAPIILKIVVGKDGIPGDLEIIQPFGFGLDEEAIKAVGKWRFKPATKDGYPVRMVATAEVSFHLNSTAFEWRSGPMAFSLDPKITPPAVKDGTMPKAEREAKDESVALGFTVTASGEVKDIRRIWGAEASAEEMAAFLSGWKFRPAMEAGTFVAAKGRVQFVKGGGDAEAGRPLFNTPSVAANSKPPAKDLSNKLTVEMLLGRYVREPRLNNWHEGHIERDGEGIRWRNAAEAAWALTPDLRNGSLLAGRAGNPYYDKEPGRGRRFEIVLDGGGKLEGFIFLGEFYVKDQDDGNASTPRDPAGSAGLQALVFGVGTGVPVEAHPDVGPSIRQKTEPDYSEAARKAKIGGTVLVMAIINETGSVIGASVAQGIGYGLDEKALECVEAWKFNPARKNGEPVKSKAAIEVNFRLQ